MTKARRARQSDPGCPRTCGTKHRPENHWSPKNDFPSSLCSQPTTSAWACIPSQPARHTCRVQGSCLPQLPVACGTQSEAIRGLASSQDMQRGRGPPKASGHSLQPCTPSRPRQVLPRRTPPSVYCSEGRPPCDLPPVSHSSAPQDNHLFAMAGGRVEGDGGWRIDKC